jgi:glyoxylase-like metal-dependent hydrolase (beta-lactamase superfamily II)
MAQRFETDAAGGVPGPGKVPEVEVGRLQEMLEGGARVSVLDIRPAAERAEWHIPGSLHRDAYRALRAGDAAALDGVPLGREAPVVTVCARGNTSRIAARLLRERGFDAASLAGGMKAWSLAWNAAELASDGLALVQVRRTGKGCLSYLVASAGEAAVVDPSLPSAIYLRLAEARGFRIRHVLDTHIHADHLSRGRELARLASARLWLPEQGRAGFPHEAARDGAEIALGRAALVAVRVPGHTLESTCYLVGGRWLLTGDTLFLDSIGRPDLAAHGEEPRARALLLHASLRRLFALDPALTVLPGHTGAPVPFDRAVIGAPLAAVRGAIALGDDAGGFADDVLGRIPPTPPNCLDIVAMNEAGELPPGDPTDLEAGANRCALA